jgi:hypothetical protein
MREMTSRELIDTIVRSLRETGRRFARLRKTPAKKPGKTPAAPIKHRAKQSKAKKGALRRKRSA